MKHPAGETHFDGAKNEEVILQIVGIGPSSTTTGEPQGYCVQTDLLKNVLR